MQKVKDKGVFHFGKYKGKTIRDIIELDLPYCIWCVNNLKCNPFTNKQIALIETTYYNRFGTYPFKRIETAEHLKYDGEYLKTFDNEKLYEIYKENPSYRWAIRLIHKSRRPILLHRSAPVFQTDDIGF
jgi:hypothetical protein